MNTKFMITKRKRGEDGYKILSIRVREDIIKRLDALAEETERSRNELIGTADLPLSDSGLLRLKLDGLSPTHAPETIVVGGVLTITHKIFLPGYQSSATIPSWLTYLFSILYTRRVLKPSTPTWSMEVARTTS